MKILSNMNIFEFTDLVRRRSQSSISYHIRSVELCLASVEPSVKSTTPKHRPQVLFGTSSGLIGESVSLTLLLDLIG